MLPGWSGWVPNLCFVRRPHSLALPEPQRPLPSREPLHAGQPAAAAGSRQLWGPRCLQGRLLPAFSSPWGPQASSAFVFTRPPSWCLSGSPNLISLSFLLISIFSKYLFGYVFLWLYWVLVEAGRIFSCGELFVAACGIQLPNQGLIPGPLHWVHAVLATGPPGKSPPFPFSYKNTRIPGSSHLRSLTNDSCKDPTCTQGHILWFQMDMNLQARVTV